MSKKKATRVLNHRSSQLSCRRTTFSTLEIPLSLKMFNFNCDLAECGNHFGASWNLRSYGLFVLDGVLLPFQSILGNSGSFHHSTVRSFSIILTVILEGLLAPRGSHDVLLHRVEAGQQTEALLFPHEVVADHVVFVCKGSFKKTEVRRRSMAVGGGVEGGSVQWRSPNKKHQLIEELILTVLHHRAFSQTLLRMLRNLIAED